MTRPDDPAFDRRTFLRGAAALAAAAAGGRPLGAAARADVPAATAPSTAPATKPYLSWFNPPKVPQPLLAHHGYDSAAMKTRVGYNLYLPPGYADGADAVRRYPVVYWLHGRGQSESTDQFPPAVVDRAIREKAIPPVIVVYASGGAESWYADSADGKWLAETTIVRELIPHVDATYRTVATRGGRAIQGMSMGGGGATKLAFKYPDLFSSVVAFAPSYRTPAEMQLEKPQAETFRRMFGGDAERFMAEHPFTLLRKNAERLRGKVGVKLFIGSADNPVLVGGCRTLHALLDELKVPHEYAEPAGVPHNLARLVAAVRTDGLAFAAKHFG